MNDSGLSFDVFLSHAREDKPAVRRLARQLEAAGFRVWLDEEQLNAGYEPDRVLPEALTVCRHILIWLTDAWLAKHYTRWEETLFHPTSGAERRVVPVLLVPWDEARLGPRLIQKVPVELELSEPERLWRIICALRGMPTGPREEWADRGQAFIETVWVNFEPRTRADLDGRVGLRLDNDLHQRLRAGGPVVGSNFELPVVFSKRAESAGPVIAAGFDDRVTWLCIDLGLGPRWSTEAAFLVYDRAGCLLATWDTGLRNDEGEVAESIQEIRRPSGDLFGLQCTIPTATGTGIDLLDFFIFAMPSREAGRWVAPSIAFSGNQRGNCSGSLYSDPLLGGPLDEFEGYEDIQIDHRIAFAEEQILLHRRGFMRRVLHSEGDGPPAEAHHVSEVLKWDPVARRFVAYL